MRDVRAGPSDQRAESETVHTEATSVLPTREKAANPTLSDKRSPGQSSREEEEEEEERDTATGGERESASTETTDKEVEMEKNDAYGVELTGRRTSSYENVLEYSTI